MGLSKRTGGVRMDKRDVLLNTRDLKGQTFFIEEIGDRFTSRGQYPQENIQVNVTLADGTEASWYATGVAVLNQLEDSEAPFTATLKQTEPKDGKNGYYFLEEAE